MEIAKEGYDEAQKVQTVFLLILCAVMIAVGFPVTVRADMGPKPSVRSF